MKMKNKVVTWLMLLLLMGSSIVTTTTTLAEGIQKNRIEKQVKDVAEQQEASEVSETKSSTGSEKRLENSSGQGADLEQSAKANDSPSLIKPAAFLGEAEQLHDRMKNVESIYLLDNVMYYQGQKLYLGKGDEVIPAKFDELMKLGASTKLMVGAEAFGLQPRSLSTRAEVTIEYGGQARAMDIYGDESIVGIFYINGIQAFCVQHELPTPGTGMTASTSFYENQKVANALYYGQNGPGTIFTDFQLGTVVTSLILDRIISGGITGQGLPQYDQLWDLVQNGNAPIGGAPSANITSSDTVVDGNYQVSKDFKLTAQAGSDTYSINVPSNVELVNKTTGKVTTNGTAKVKSGETFYYRAGLTYDTKYISDKIGSSVGKYQPILAVTGGGYQNIAYGQWVTDPTSTIQLTVNFEAKVGDFEIQKVAEETNTPLAGIKFEITIDGKTEIHETDETGKITIKDLLHGTEVHWKELEAPEGYYDYQEGTTTVVAGKTTTANIVNKIQKGRIKGIKLKEVFKPSETFEKGEPVYEIIPAEGIKFDNEVASETITRPNGSVVEDWKTGTVVDTLTTNEKGEFASNVDLYIGKQNEYQLKELEVPDNYRQPEELKAPYSIDYDSPEYDVITYDLGEVNNMLKTAKVKMNKVNELTGLPIAGAEFYVEGISENTKDVQFKFVSAITPVEHKLKEGFYRYTEVKYPDGFGQTTGESETKIIEVKDGQDITLTWKNSPETKVGKGTIRTQAHTGDGKTNTFTHGDIINAYDDIDIENDTLIGKTGKGQFEAILVAALPDGSRQEIWKSGIMDYVIEDGKFATQVVKKEVDTSKYPEGTFFYFKENVTPEGEKEPTIHNSDGEVYEQGLYPKKGTLPQTGEKAASMVGVVLGVVLLGSIAGYHLYKSYKTKKEDSLDEEQE